MARGNQNRGGQIARRTSGSRSAIYGQKADRALTAQTSRSANSTSASHASALLIEFASQRGVQWDFATESDS